METADTKRVAEHLTTIALCGDVMTGRGIDQILPHPSVPVIYESYLEDARDYVKLAEEANGPIDRPVSYSYIWGDALEEFDLIKPDVRIINLETSITKSDEYWKGKGINYRMHPENIQCLTAAAIDICALANNHILDWGYPGLIETMETLRKAGIKGAGAGRNLKEAETPAVTEVPGRGRVVFFSYGSDSSGIPLNWAALPNRPGINMLLDFSETTVRHIGEIVWKIKQPNDFVIASIHWGSNWGYEIPREQTEFAHGLIDIAGVDLIHGHSSHHARGIEVYKDKLILYGCGDFLNDYEGIGGYEDFRGDLSLLYFPAVDPLTGRLQSLQMAPMQIRRFRVNRASLADAVWLEKTLNREGRTFGTGVELTIDNRLILLW